MGIFGVSIEHELPKAMKMLEAVSRSKWPGILVSAANETAYYVLNKYKQQMPSFLDRPTPFTLNSMYVNKASGGKLEATVQWKDSDNRKGSAGQYLQPEVFGGDRRAKGFEKALQALGLMPRGYHAVPTPGGLQLDSYGNVPRGIYQAVLASLKANPTTQNEKQVQRLGRMSKGKLVKSLVKTALNYNQVKAKDLRAAKRKAKYFTAIRGQGTRLSTGIYERLPGGQVRQIFFFVSEANYRKQFPFFDIGEAAARSKFPEKLAEAISTALSRTKL